MAYNLRNLISLVWRRKWEGVVGIIGILLAMAGYVPAVRDILLAISAIVLIALILDLARGTREAVNILRVKHIPIVVNVGKDEDQYRAMLDDAFATVAKFGFGERDFAEDFGVFRDDLVVRVERDLPYEPQEVAAWAEVAGKFESRITRLAARLRGRRVYHIFFRGPVALAVGLGAMLRTLYEVVLYNHQPGSEPPYAPVIDFYALSKDSGKGTALVQEMVAEYRYTAVEKPNQLTAHTFVSVHLFGKDPKIDVERLARSQNAAGVHIRNTYGSTLPPAGDWLIVARETQTVLRELARCPEVQRLELCLSCNPPMAFAIGMALGTHFPITVRAWDTTHQEFRPVLELNTLRPTR